MARDSTGTTKKTGKKTAATPGRARPTRRSKQSVVPARAPAIGVQPDAVSLLRADHRTARQLLADLKSEETPTQRQRLLAQVKQEPEVHTQIEEEIFYRAFRTAAKTRRDHQLVPEATAEHRAADLMLKEVGSADDATEEFPGRAKVLKEVVEHHAGEEETDMFPRAREILGAAELRALGQQMAERKRTLLRARKGPIGTLRKTDFVRSPFSSAAKTSPEPRV